MNSDILVDAEMVNFSTDASVWLNLHFQNFSIGKAWWWELVDPNRSQKRGFMEGRGLQLLPIIIIIIIIIIGRGWQSQSHGKFSETFFTLFTKCKWNTTYRFRTLQRTLYSGLKKETSAKQVDIIQITRWMV